MAFPATQTLSKRQTTSAYNAWLMQEVKASVDDPHPSIPHKVVMAEISRVIALLKCK